MCVKIYRTKPKEVEAIQWTTMNTNEILQWCPQGFTDSYGLSIPTIDGVRLVFVGDYIVKNSKGQFKIYDEETFNKLFDSI